MVKRSRKIAFTKLKILGAGFVPGFLSGLAVKTGIDLKSGAIDMFAKVCSFNVGHLPFTCLAWVAILPLILTVASLLWVYLKLKKIKGTKVGPFRINSWLVALLLYIVGFMIGTNVAFILLALL